MSDGGPAFPGFGEVFITDGSGRTNAQSAWGMNGSQGMSLRDYFAACVLSAFARSGPGSFEWLAKNSYEMADAMLAAREAKP